MNLMSECMPCKVFFCPRVALCGKLSQDCVKWRTYVPVLLMMFQSHCKYIKQYQIYIRVGSWLSGRAYAVYVGRQFPVLLLAFSVRRQHKRSLLETVGTRCQLECYDDKMEMEALCMLS